jgi:hypothetical protein
MRSDDQPTQLQLMLDGQREVATHAAAYRCQEIREWTLNLALDSPLNAHLRLQCPWNPPDKEVPKQGLAASRPLVRQREARGSHAFVRFTDNFYSAFDSITVIATFHKFSRRFDKWEKMCRKLTGCGGVCCKVGESV